MRSCEYLGITTDIRISSDIAIDHELKGQDKVLALCHASGADTYINAIGGLELYDRDVFRAQGVALKFARSKPFEYAQFGAPFLPWLSIVDVLMFNPIDSVTAHVRQEFDLI
jgi:hypothetical protein